MHGLPAGCDSIINGKKEQSASERKKMGLVIRWGTGSGRHAREAGMRASCTVTSHWGPPCYNSYLNAEDLNPGRTVKVGNDRSSIGGSVLRRA